MKRVRRMFSLCILAALSLGGCMSAGNGDSRVPAQAQPEIPEQLDRGEDGVPVLSVYELSKEKASDMDLETYVMGVVAGEMKNDWPLEALKAQAILARTFVLKFCQDKRSRYDGADISTDVSEAQAYDAGGVNDRVRRAVEDTRGLVMSVGGEYPYAWFHAHSGGMTELPSAALEFKDGDPEYLKPMASRESEKAPEEAKHWRAVFDLEQVRQACADAGVKTGPVERIEIGEKGDSGRARTLLVNGEEVSAPSFRIQIGANRLRSTLIDSVQVSDGKAIFEGRGFGHGVGLSQWGAYAMAEEGENAEAIVTHYFPGVDIVSLW